MAFVDWEGELYLQGDIGNYRRVAADCRNRS